MLSEVENEIPLDVISMNNTLQCIQVKFCSSIDCTTVNLESKRMQIIPFNSEREYTPGSSTLRSCENPRTSNGR